LKSMPALEGKTVFDTLTSVPDLIILEYPTLFQVKKALKQKYIEERDAFFNIDKLQIEKIADLLGLKVEDSAEVETVFVDDNEKNYSSQLTAFEQVTELIPNKYKQSVSKINIYLSNTNASSFAAYNKESKSINLSLLSTPSNFISEIAHEYGHLVEEFNPTIKNKSWDFFNTRAPSLEMESISEILHDQGEEYDTSKYPDLSVYKGSFISPYVGRVYGEVSEKGPTEVISIGLQSLFLDPINFLFKDVEHFNLIYKLLKGEL
jgi:hypothetical protein